MMHHPITCILLKPLISIIPFGLIDTNYSSLYWWRWLPRKYMWLDQVTCFIFMLEGKEIGREMDAPKKCSRNFRSLPIILCQVGKMVQFLWQWYNIWWRPQSTQQSFCGGGLQSYLQLYWYTRCEVHVIPKIKFWTVWVQEYPWAISLVLLTSF